MSPPHNLEKLRRALDVPDGFNRLTHRDRTEGLRNSLSHSVRYLELVDGSTCLTYALSLFRDKTYLAIAGSFFDYQIFAGKLFVEWLVENSRLKEITEPVAGCLVLYFADGAWRHAGIALSSGRIVSQWGTFPVYEHELFEVPASYGDHVRYFLPINALKALALFVKFAKSHFELSDEDIARAVQYDTEHR